LLLVANELLASRLGAIEFDGKKKSAANATKNQSERQEYHTIKNDPNGNEE
jgi:hypothetical protein